MCPPLWTFRIIEFVPRSRKRTREGGHSKKWAYLDTVKPFVSRFIISRGVSGYRLKSYVPLALVPMLYHQQACMPFEGDAVCDMRVPYCNKDVRSDREPFSKM